jgi:hypothetical protein
MPVQPANIHFGVTADINLTPFVPKISSGDHFNSGL